MCIKLAAYFTYMLNYVMLLDSPTFVRWSMLLKIKP